jgi:membrane protein implicated in regulation of membrane protease activity
VKPPRGRAVVTLAVGFLALDAVLLVYAGASTGRWALHVAAVACAAGAVLVISVWRRYRAALHELDDARRAMRAEIQSIRELLQHHHLNN